MPDTKEQFRLYKNGRWFQFILRNGDPRWTEDKSLAGVWWTRPPAEEAAFLYDATIVVSDPPAQAN